MFWHYDLSSWAKQVFLLATYPAACVLLLAGLMARRRALTRVAVVLIVIGGVVGVSDAVITLSPPAPWAVVVAHSEGRSGDGPAYSVVAPSIVAGQEVRILETRPQWVRVEMPSGLRCWLPSDDCEPV